MSVLSVDGFPVVRGSIRMPRRGAWVAEVMVDTAMPLEGQVTLASYDGAFTLVGTVQRGAVCADAWHGRIVGGAAGLSKELSAQSYRSLPLRTPLGDILSAAGERLASSSDPSTLSLVLPSWSRAKSTAGSALAALVDAADATWRVLEDGAVWVGRDTWPVASDFPHDVLVEDPGQGRALLGIEAPRLLPGTTFLGRRVSLVVHVVDDQGVRSDVWFEREGEGSRLFDALRRFVRKALARVDYYALYPARVVAQNGDLTLELKPDTDRMPPVSRVPIRTGFPSAKVKVAPGARVLLGFEMGDPRRPIASLWDGDGLIELQLGGVRAIARQGDQVALTMPAIIPITGTVTPPLPTGATFVGTMTVKTPLIGAILTGSGIVKAG